MLDFVFLSRIIIIKSLLLLLSCAVLDTHRHCRLTEWTWPTLRKIRSTWITRPGRNSLLNWLGRTRRSPSRSPISRGRSPTWRTMILCRSMALPEFNWGGKLSCEDLLTLVFVLEWCETLNGQISTRTDISVVISCITQQCLTVTPFRLQGVAPLLR